MRTRLRGPAGFVAVLTVLAAGSASAPARVGPGDARDQALYATCRTELRKLAEKYRHAQNVAFSMECERPDGTIVDPRLWAPAAPIRPAPTRPITAGRPGCVTGPGRPVVGTTLTSVSATAGADDRIIVDYQPLGGPETIATPGSAVLEFGPGDLLPGGTYRWRARVDDSAEQTVFGSLDDDEARWSPWCEFTVSADAAD
jgi:hypothetical protein